MTSSSSSLPPSALLASWRRWARFGSESAPPGRRWLALAWTAVFSAVVAFGFTSLGFAVYARTLDDWLSLSNWTRWYGRNLVVALVIGYTIHALFAFARFVAGAERIQALRGWRRTAFFMGVPLAGVAIGWPLGVSLPGGNLHVLQRLSGGDVASFIVIAVLTSALIHIFFSQRQRELQAEMRATDARLQLLQGQMEPHFLFNTLANVISLIDADAPRAREVLEAFTEYLRASLGSLRRGESTLGAELELATRFLHLMHMRMGDRLRFEIDVDPALRTAALPPLLLQPLIENAVKHGLEPQVEGGTVRVRVERVDGGVAASLRICVEDDGVGIEAATARARCHAQGAPGGNGIALETLRERLRTQYGGAASLTLEARAGGVGTLASLVVPHRTGSTERAVTDDLCVGS